MPKISVIIPVHNTAKYLPTCLNSVVNQNIEDIEIICVNDHSCDQSLDILYAFAKNYSPKIKVMDMQEKTGVSCARNEGLKIADGKYIGFVDSDDVIALNMFHDFYQLAKEYQVPIVVGHNKRITSSKFLNKETFITAERKNAQLINPTTQEAPFICACWDKLFNHDFIENTFFLENHIYEDVGFTYPLLYKAQQIIQVQEQDYLYRQNACGISESSAKINPQIFDIFDVSLDALKRGKKANFSPKQMVCLENDLKKAIICRLQYITKWPIENHYKKFIIEKILSSCNYYFKNIKQIYCRDFENANNALMNLKEYSYEELLSQKDSLKELKRAQRLTRSLQKTSKTGIIKES